MKKKVQDAIGTAIKYLSRPAMGIITFYGHHQTGDEIDKSCLSNFFVADFFIAGEDGNHPGLTFHSVEQYMMYHKAVLMGDQDTAMEILAAKTPAKCKKLGRLIYPWDQAKWDDQKESIVFRGIMHKFKQNPDLKEYLKGTKGQLLVEAASRDTIWGVGQDHTLAKDIKKWKGQNLLGFLLMQARDQIIEENDNRK